MDAAVDTQTQAQQAAEIESMFELFDDWEDKYQVLIDLGKDLPRMDPADKNEETRVIGCQSNVWVVARVKQTRQGPVVEFSADSDAAITKGLVSILWRLFSGQPAQNILTFDIEAFIERLGLSSHLSMQRRNGLSGMVRRVKTLASEQME
jgi:cysteine desulfuration protein SufE